MLPIQRCLPRSTARTGPPAVFEAKRMSWSELSAKSPLEIDAVLTDFVKAMHQAEGAAAFRIAKHATLFMQIWQPRLRRNLPETWDNLISWEELRPANFRPPLPVAVLIALICEARRWSLTIDDPVMSDRLLTFAALTGLCFFGMLRPGEMFKLKPADISLPNDISLGSERAIIRLRQPKNARQMGRQQYASVARRTPGHHRRGSVASKQLTIRIKKGFCGLDLNRSSEPYSKIAARG